ncbi:MAG: nucleotide exchange factor GrpE [Chloroflexi bacterium]|nr:nucleotide exchange factor GrpE [Chloroflexota bacterium]
MTPAADEQPPAPGDTEQPPAAEALPSPDPLSQLQSQLDAANAKAAEYLDGWQRARADFANYKKRVEREQVDAYQNAAVAVLTRMLPVLDDLDLTLRNAPTAGEAAQWAVGVTLVRRKFVALLENENIKPIEAEGRPFDPNFHEAVVHEETTDHAAGHVVEVLRQGYKLGDRVLRPALVKVAK